MRVKNVNDVNAKFNASFVDFNPKISDVREYDTNKVHPKMFQDPNLKKALTEGPLVMNRRVKTNDFVSNAMRVK